jgi:alkylhydroperoxidase family enzyme
VSSLNECAFCHASHAATALALEPAPKSTPKMDALLALAGKVQKSGRAVTEEDVTKAKAAGATDREIHDTVLVAAAFCMLNRYVDGLGTSPAPAEMYPMIGQRLANQGYGQP